MKATQSSSTARTVTGFAVGAFLLLGLTACGDAEGDYEGTYRGSSGNTVLTLEPEGQASYSQERRTGASVDTGTWRIEGDTLIVEPENLSYPIMADISNSPESLTFTAENSRWNDEIFSKD